MCPGVHLVEARHRVYTEFHHKIVAAVESCLPVHEVRSIDEMICALKGRDRVPENAIALAQEVKQAIKSKVGDSLRCSVGLAPNRYLSKVASDMQKPDGLTVLLKKDLPQSLFRLGLRDLPGIGPKTEARLGERGIWRVEQLCSMSGPALRELWGSVWGERFYDWLHGDDAPEPEQVSHSLSQSHVLEPEMRTRDGAFTVAKKLVNKIAFRLRKENGWAGGMNVSLKYFGEPKWDRHARLDEKQDTPTLLKTLGTLWKDAPFRNPYYVGIALAPIIPAERHIPSLFDNGKQEKLSKVMDEINRRHGKETAWYAALSDVRKSESTPIAFNHIPDLDDDF
jgi:DNA polymerase-4